VAAIAMSVIVTVASRRVVGWRALRPQINDSMKFDAERADGAAASRAEHGSTLRPGG